MSYLSLRAIVKSDNNNITKDLKVLCHANILTCKMHISLLFSGNIQSHKDEYF